jgi:RNA polymerase sigma factor (sigma-70 family)
LHLVMTQHPKTVPTPIPPEILLAESGFLRALVRALLFPARDTGAQGADDLVQQTWLQALQKPPRERGALRVFLARIAQNLVHNAGRGEQRRARREREAARDEAVPSVADLAERETRRREVVDAVFALPEPYRSVVVLRYYEGLRPAAIARRLECGGSAARMRLSRALQMLRARLDQAHGGDRRAWAVPLLPLLRARDAVPSATAVALPALGALAALAFVVLGVFGRSEDLQPSPPVASETAKVEDAGTAAPRPGEAPRRVAVGSGPAMQDVAPPLGALTGRLVDEEQRPLSGYPVRLIVLEPAALLGLGERPPAATLATTSRADGRFELEHVAAGAQSLLHAGSDRDCGRWFLLGQAPLDGEHVDLGDLVLLRKGTITGRVTADGAPVAGAEVWAIDLPGATLAAAPLQWFDPTVGLALRARDSTTPLVLDLPPAAAKAWESLPIARTHTASDGSFVLRGVEPGDNILVARKPGRLGTSKPRVRVEAGAARDAGEIRLRGGESLCGVVWGAGGEPIAGAEVLVGPFQGLELARIAFFVRRVTTDARGRFEARDLPGGRLLVAARAARGEPWVTTQHPGAAQDLRLQLPPRSAIELRWHGVPAGGRPRLRLLSGEQIGERQALGLTDEVQLVGRLTEQGNTVRIERLPHGVYTLFVECEGVAPSTHRLEVSVAEGPVDVHLAASTLVDVTVVDPGGRPAAGARIHVRPEDAPPSSASILPHFSFLSVRLPFWSHLPSAVVVTDAAGRARVQVAPGTALLFDARHPAHGQAQAKATFGAAPGSLRLMLGGSGAIIGRLTDRGAPPAPLAWHVLARPLDDEQDRGERAAFPDAQGRFQLPGLPAGRYEVTAVRADARGLTLGAILESTNPFGFFDAVQSSREVTVEPGRTAEVHFDTDATRAGPDQPAGELVGRIEIDGAPAAGLQVLRAGQWGDDQELAVTDAAGAFRLAGLAPGRLRLLVRRPPSTDLLWSRTIDVRLERKELPISLRTGSVRGLARLASGRPAVRYRVALLEEREDEGGAWFEVDTDLHGRFTLGGVPAGRYYCLGRGDRGEGKGTPFDVGPGATHETVLELEPRSAVVGRIDQSLEVGKRIGVGIQNSELFVSEVMILDDTREFRFGGLRAGRYKLTVSGPLLRDAKVDPAEIEVGPDEEREVVLRLAK